MLISSSWHFVPRSFESLPLCILSLAFDFALHLQNPFFFPISPTCLTCICTLTCICSLTFTFTFTFTLTRSLTLTYISNISSKLRSNPPSSSSSSLGSEKMAVGEGAAAPVDTNPKDTLLVETETNPNADWMRENEMMADDSFMVGWLVGWLVGWILVLYLCACDGIEWRTRGWIDWNEITHKVRTKLKWLMKSNRNLTHSQNGNGKKWKIKNSPFDFFLFPFFFLFLLYFNFFQWRMHVNARLPMNSNDDVIRRRNFHSLFISEEGYFMVVDSNNQRKAQQAKALQASTSTASTAEEGNIFNIASDNWKPTSECKVKVCNEPSFLCFLPCHSPGWHFLL